MSKKAVVLLSGGLDSAVALSLAKEMGFEVHTLSFVYGQKHTKEIDCAKYLSKKEGAQHHILSLNMDEWGGSSLTDDNMTVKDGDMNNEEIPNTYVPARNMVFLSLAASLSEAIGARDIFIGVSEVDYSGYVDCREVFIKAMENAINLGTVCGAEHNDKITLHAPFVHKTKAQEIELGMKLGTDFAHTWTCYKGDEKPCGVCDSCLLRAKAFEEAGFEDPAL